MPDTTKRWMALARLLLVGGIEAKIGGKCYEVTLLPEPTAQQRVGYVLALLKAL